MVIRSNRLVGIVGHEAAKFTADTEKSARAIIRDILSSGNVIGMVSGGCHLGGIDIWAEEIADDLGITAIVFKPIRLVWSGTGGYKSRNIDIADASDIVHVITVRELPPTYKGMRFSSCYHCATTEHVKSGGCWTARYAMRIGKKAEWHVV